MTLTGENQEARDILNAIEKGIGTLTKTYRAVDMARKACYTTMTATVTATETTV